MYFRELTEMIRKDSRLKLLLTAAVVVQVITCITAVGHYHPDQHFQLIEFSSYQLHQPSAAGKVWEFSAHLRSTIQVYLFSAYSRLCMGLGIGDPYVQLEVLRLVFGLTLWVFFNGITLYYFRRGGRPILYLVLLLLNFSWILPYTRTLFSSEMLSSLLFFGALFLYENGKRSWGMALLTGFLFSLAFYARFQTAFAIAGFLVWMLWPGRRQGILPLALGFLPGVFLNTVLDHGFYHQWVCTPYTYFRVNILEGKAASMGTSSFLVYIAVLAAVVLTPPMSIFLLFAGFRTSLLKKLDHPLVLSVVFFIVGHCLVAHKEERFLFPIVNVLPIIVGWGLPGLIDWVRSRRRGWRGLIRGIGWFSAGLNVFLLSVLLFTPYSQAIHFTSQLRNNFRDRDKPATIYAVGRTPFETEHHLPFVFYRTRTDNMRFKVVGDSDSLRLLPDTVEYITTTYDQLIGKKVLPDSLGYQRVLYSSRLLWGVNETLESIGMNTINDIWVLYKKR